MGSAAGSRRWPVLVPELFRSLDAPELKGAVPEGALEALQREYSNNVGRNLRLLSASCDGYWLSASARRAVILLKGAYLAHFSYHDIGARYMCDLDLMVHYAHAQTVAETLVAQGYEPLKEFNLGPTPPPTHHLPRFIKERTLGVEVHWTIGHAGAAVSVDTEQLWARSIPVSSTASKPSHCPLPTCSCMCVYTPPMTTSSPWGYVRTSISPKPSALWTRSLIGASVCSEPRVGIAPGHLPGSPPRRRAHRSGRARVCPSTPSPRGLRTVDTSRGQSQIFADKVLDGTALPKLADLRVPGSPWGTLEGDVEAVSTVRFVSWHLSGGARAARSLALRCAGGRADRTGG